MMRVENEMPVSVLDVLRVYVNMRSNHWKQPLPGLGAGSNISLGAVTTYQSKNANNLFLEKYLSEIV